jgi:Putative transposase
MSSSTKDTRNHNRFSRVRFSNEEFLVLLKEQVPDRGAHAMRYFGLLAPRTKACTWGAIFAFLGQKKRPHPPRLPWRWLLWKTFGTDPLTDSNGQVMHWVGWLAPSPPGA